MIINKRQLILNSINQNRLQNERLELKFSNGWLFSSKKRNGFKRFKSHGESGSTSLNNTAQELPISREELSHYYLNDI